VTGGLDEGRDMGDAGGAQRETRRTAMNVDHLPVPKLEKALDMSHLRTVCKVLGVALVAQFFIPWGGGIYLVVNFASIWSLITGIALAIFGFVPFDGLPRGIYLSVLAGTAFIGVVSLMTVPQFMLFGFPFLIFGMLGLTALAFGLLRWARQGHDTLSAGIVWGGVVCVGLSLLIPVGGQVPLIGMFQALAGEGANVAWGIFYFIFALAYIGIAVATVIFVLLPGAKAGPSMVRLIGVGIFPFVLVTALLLGLLFTFTPHVKGMLLLSLHAAIILLSYMFLLVYAGNLLLTAVREGRLPRLFQA